jgi:hypothetical protein
MLSTLGEEPINAVARGHCNAQIASTLGLDEAARPRRHRSLAFQAFRDKQARPQHTAVHESNISTSTGRMTNQRFVSRAR